MTLGTPVVFPALAAEDNDFWPACLADNRCADALYVPDRVQEGFGPNIKALQLLESTHSLIICVDCGTLSHDVIESVLHSDILVLDHHLASETLPKCHAVVNPNRQDELGNLSHLCAAAVVFLCLVEMRRLLRANEEKSPDLLEMLDLVALDRKSVV